MPNLPRPDALILCGGEGSRLGGIDKPLQPFAGRALIESVIARIAAQVGVIRLSANRSACAYSEYGDIYDDGEFAGCGPLAGLAIGLAHATTDHLLCVPGDAPMLPADLAIRLEAERERTGAAIVHAVDGRGPQPLCCLVDCRLRDDLIDYLRGGGSAPREWFACHRAVTADFSDSPSWAWSLNTPEEWRAAELQLAALKLAL